VDKLNIKQLNTLLTGGALATEIPSTSDELRAFVDIKAYNIDEDGRIERPSKYINAKDQHKYKFRFRKYEVKAEYIENDWDVHEEDLINAVFMVDIASIEELEGELIKYLRDLSLLDNEWKCDNPL
jgi:soluble P-type ATPase